MLPAFKPAGGRVIIRTSRSWRNVLVMFSRLIDASMLFMSHVHWNVDGWNDDARQSNTDAHAEMMRTPTQPHPPRSANWDPGWADWTWPDLHQPFTSQMWPDGPDSRRALEWVSMRLR